MVSQLRGSDRIHSDHLFQNLRMFHTRFQPTEPNFRSLGHMLVDALGTDLQGLSGGRAALPAVNVFETPDAYRLEVVAPGRKREDFQLSLDNHVLTVRTEATPTTAATDATGTYTRREYAHGAFTRAFRLPGSVQADNIGAHYQGGILAITLPKREDAKPKPARQIEVA
jgi:HSP20 family protein